VLVTDYQLGLQFAGELALRPRQAVQPALRILVMTGRDREHEVRFALEQGVHGYLPVGCTLQELSAAVLALGRGSRYLSVTAATRMADSLGRESLTQREAEVLGLLACGECNKSIARRLDIAIGTVKAHVKSIMDKLDADSRTQAVSIANERGLVEVARASPPPSLTRSLWSAAMPAATRRDLPAYI
jgi:DNA-binding NarL/FixJ family response regulator